MVLGDSAAPPLPGPEPKSSMVFGWNAPPAPPQVAQHLAQDVIEELELELADREAKRRRLVVQSSYASVLLFALAEPADLVLVRWPAGMVSVARVMSAPAEAAPNLLHVECCITADGERIRGAVPPSAVEVVNEHNFERLLAEVLKPANLRKLAASRSNTAEQAREFLRRAIKTTSRNVMLELSAPSTKVLVEAIASQAELSRAAVDS